MTFSYLADRPARRPGHLGAYVMAGIVGCLLAFVAVAAFYSVLVDRQERISREEGQLRELHAQQEQLRLRIFRAESPVNVLQQAERLGLSEPEEVENLSVPQDLEPTAK